MSDERERVDRLNVWASRHHPDHPEWGPHEYMGACPWCRADEPEGMEGGAHSNASWLIQRLYDAECEAAQRAEDLRLANDAFLALLSSTAPVIEAARKVVDVLGHSPLGAMYGLRSAVHAFDANNSPEVSR